MMVTFNFITSFFVSKKLSLLTAFVCWPPDETWSLWRRAGDAGLRLRVYPALLADPPLPAQGDRREGVLLDVRCPHAGDILLKASSNRAFIHRYTWLLLDSSPFNATMAADILDSVAILPDSDVTWSSPDVSADVYRVKEDRPLLVARLDLDRSYDTAKMEAMWKRLPTAVTRRKDLRNVYFNAVTIITQPQHFKGWTDLNDRQIDTFPKLTYPLMMLLGEDLNFRYNMRQVDVYGEQRNGSFDGAAGLLQRGRADLGVTSMFMRADRSRVLHFAAETVTLRGAFIFRQPSQSSVSNVFVLPFSGGVWAASGALLALAALALAALARGLRRARPDLAALTPPECFTFALASVCQQGFHVSPSCASARVLMFSTLVWSVFVFTAYSAKIVSLLQTPSAAIQTLDDLAASPMELGVQETTYKRVYFAESTEAATQRLYRHKLLPLGDRAYLSVVDGVARLRTGLFAFQVEESSGYDIISKTFTEREKCGLQLIPAFRLPMVAVPIRKHSGLRELVAARFRWQREAGLMSRWRRVWLADAPRCDAGAAGFVSVRLADVLPAFQVLCAGAAVAVASLCAERAHHAARHRRRWTSLRGYRFWS